MNLDNSGEGLGAGERMEKETSVILLTTTKYFFKKRERTGDGESMD